MSHSDYQRVNRKRVCLICGKPDWCSFTPDEKISFCARIIQNANRLSRTGWGVFYHDKTFSESRRLPCPDKPPSKKPELAPIEIRNFVYRKLIELAPATNSEAITDGAKGLRERKILDFENYGSLPQSFAERCELAKQIRRLINLKFPDYVRKQNSSVGGFPGFWLDKRGKIKLWTDKNYSIPMMLIPYRDANGSIQACQIRFMCSDLKGLRYVWLSTPKKSGGLSTGSPLHFASRHNDSSNKPILVTEGALKAQTIQNLRPEFRVLANGGVTCSHPEIISNSRFQPLYIAFDADYLVNRHVTRAFANLLNLRLLDAEKHKYLPQTGIFNWSSSIKSFDDALLGKFPIRLIKVFEWFNSLCQIYQHDICSSFQHLVLNFHNFDILSQDFTP